MYTVMYTIMTLCQGQDYVSQIPMAANGGAHKFNKNDIDIDVVVSSISILDLESISAFARTYLLSPPPTLITTLGWFIQRDYN